MSNRESGPATGNNNVLRENQLQTFSSFEILEQAAERGIIRNYQGGLIDLKSILGSFFERYEAGGRLTYDEMAQYSRLQKMMESVNGITVQLYSENTRVIAQSLSTTYKHSFQGASESVSRAWGNQSLIGIIREGEMNAAINSNITGLNWAERMDLHRDQAAAKVRETIVRGLHDGETYAQMAARLNEALGKDVPNAIRIVRTESYRVFSQAQKDRLDRVQGVSMMKRWLTADDEAVRANHIPMNLVKVPYNDNFILPNGNQGFAPGMIGAASDDINCRCTWVVEMADDMGHETSIQEVDFKGEDDIIGIEDKTMDILPKYEDAVIPQEKFTKYALDSDKDPDKATAFRMALGYTQENSDLLIENIRHNIPNFESVFKGNNGFGDTYECVMNLKGENGKTANVVTSWIIENGDNFPRLTSAYVTNKKMR